MLKNNCQCFTYNVGYIREKLVDDNKLLLDYVDIYQLEYYQQCWQAREPFSTTIKASHFFLSKWTCFCSLRDTLRVNEKKKIIAQGDFTTTRESENKKKSPVMIFVNAQPSFGLFLSDKLFRSTAENRRESISLRFLISVIRSFLMQNWVERCAEFDDFRWLIWVTEVTDMKSPRRHKNHSLSISCSCFLLMPDCPWTFAVILLHLFTAFWQLANCNFMAWEIFPDEFYKNKSATIKSKILIQFGKNAFDVFVCSQCELHIVNTDTEFYCRREFLAQHQNSVYVLTHTSWLPLKGDLFLVVANSHELAIILFNH